MSSPSLSHRIARRSSENDDLVTKVDKIELHKDNEERIWHAQLIRQWLIKINQDYKNRFGSPTPSKSLSPRVDVEMLTA